MVDIACGLDFGTSNSALALIKDGQPFLVPIDRGRSTIPSAIFYNFEDDSTCFGQQAVEEYVMGTEGRLMRSLKSILGTSLVSEKTQLRRRSIAFTEIIAEFLHHMKKSTESLLGVSLRDVVAGRPVHFIDDDPEADKQAEREFADIVKSVGFRKVRFQYEPIAAAYQYGLTAGTSGELAFIVDIGGGTSDFSIVRSDADSTDQAGSILAAHGVHLGGNDIDRIVALDTIMPLLGYRSAMRDKNLPVPNWLYNDLASWHKINTLYSNRVRTLVRQIGMEAEHPELIERLSNVLENRKGHHLLGSAEAVKIKLSHDRAVSVPLTIAKDDIDLDVSRTQLRDLLRHWLSTIRKSIDHTLKLGGVGSGEIGSVFLTGGTTLSPIVQSLVKNIFPNAKIESGDSFGSVGLGLAIDADRQFNR